MSTPHVRYSAARRQLAAGGAILALFLLAGCSSSSSGSAGTSSVSAAPTPATLTVSDAWAKVADTGMTAVFGTIANASSHAVTITSATSPVSPQVQLHETVNQSGSMVMQQKPGGFVIPAGGSESLQPSGDHIMLMDLTTPIKPGDDVPVSLVLADGQHVSFTAVGKTFSGANESYQPSGMSGMSGMSSSK